MRRMALVLALVLPILPVALQDPNDDPPAPEEKVGGLAGLRARQEKANAEMLDKLQGAWALRELANTSTPIDPKDIFGFATFVDGYLSIVIHARAREPEPELLFQASISQFEIKESGMLRAASMVGHSNFSGVFDLEMPNLPREFIVDVSEHDLFLTRPDNSTLVFRRLQPGHFTHGAQSILEEMRAAGD